MADISSVIHGSVRTSKRREQRSGRRFIGSYLMIRRLPGLRIPISFGLAFQLHVGPFECYVRKIPCLIESRVSLITLASSSSNCQLRDIVLGLKKSRLVTRLVGLTTRRV